MLFVKKVPEYPDYPECLFAPIGFLCWCQGKKQEQFCQMPSNFMKKDGGDDVIGPGSPGTSSPWSCIM